MRILNQTTTTGVEDKKNASILDSKQGGNSKFLLKWSHDNGSSGKDQIYYCPRGEAKITLIVYTA